MWKTNASHVNTAGITRSILDMKIASKVAFLVAVFLKETITRMLLPVRVCHGCAFIFVPDFFAFAAHVEFRKERHGGERAAEGKKGEGEEEETSSTVRKTNTVWYSRASLSHRDRKKNTPILIRLGLPPSSFQRIPENANIDNSGVFTCTRYF